MWRQLLVSLLIFATGSAHAATISNLSAQADTVDVWDAEGYKPAVIEANAKLDFAGDTKVRYGGIEKRLGAHDTFVIWGNGHFLIQSSRK